MAELAKAGDCVALKCVADRLKLSDGYLEQLMAMLKKAGLVKSVRGAKGGYLLTRPAQEISVGEVLRALEGDLSPVSCVGTEGDDGCQKGGCDDCCAKPVWEQLFSSMNNVVDSISLDELISPDVKSRDF